MVGLITITDEQADQRYAKEFLRVLKPYWGKLVAADVTPKLMEGRLSFTKVVVLEFEDEASFNTWFESAEYQSSQMIGVPAPTRLSF